MKYSLENVFTVNLPKFWHQKVKNNIYEDNYEFKLGVESYEEVANILEKMILKDRQQRISLEEVKERLGSILDAYE